MAQLNEFHVQHTANRLAATFATPEPVPLPEPGSERTPFILPIRALPSRGINLTPTSRAVLPMLVAVASRPMTKGLGSEREQEQRRTPHHEAAAERTRRQVLEQTPLTPLAYLFG